MSKLDTGQRQVDPGQEHLLAAGYKEEWDTMPGDGEDWSTLAATVAGAVVARLTRLAVALERLAAQGDVAAKRDAERWEWEKEARAQQVAAMERFQETVRAAPGMQPAPDWNGIMARMFRALLIREGLDPASLPEIPEDPSELPGWLERLQGRGGDLPSEGGAEPG